jgi:hypothetical protein
MSNPITIEAYTEEELYKMLLPLVQTLIHCQSVESLDLNYGPITDGTLAIKLKVTYSTVTGVLHVHILNDTVEAAPEVYCIAIVSKLAMLADNEQALRQEIFRRIGSVIVQAVTPYLTKENITPVLVENAANVVMTSPKTEHIAI